MSAFLQSLGYDVQWVLPALLGIPVIGALVCWFLPPESRLPRSLALATLGLTAFLSFGLWWLIPDAPASRGLVADYPWIEEFGSRFRLAATGLSVPMVLLTTIMMPIAVLGTRAEQVTRRPNAFYALVLLLTAGMLGIFLAADLLVFYVSWEVMLIPLYFLIGVWGGERGPRASLTFVIYTMVGSLLMLVAIIIVGRHANGLTYDDIFRMASDKPLNYTTQFLCFGAFAAAFLVKSALVPFHTWLPEAQGEAPPLAAVALGIKVGTYGLMAIAMPLFPFAATSAAVRFTLGVLGVVAILYGSLVALAQPDFRRVMSYASIAHLGFVVLGIAAFTRESLQGAMLVMVNAGITTGGMFLLLGMLRDRTRTDRWEDLGGLAKAMPMLGTMMVLLTLANIGLPGTNGFVGEFLVLLGSFVQFPWLTLIATAGVILAAAYLLWAVQRTLFGTRDAALPAVRDLGRREAGVMAVLAVLIIGLGLAPSPMQDRMARSIHVLVSTAESNAPGPAETVGGSQ